MICRQYLDTRQAPVGPRLSEVLYHYIWRHNSGALTPCGSRSPSFLFQFFLFFKTWYETFGDSIAMTCSHQDLMLIFYCLRRFCETIVQNGYQWICLVVSKCYLNLSFLGWFFSRHVPHECYSLPSRVGVGGIFFFFKKTIISGIFATFHN